MVEFIPSADEVTIFNIKLKRIVGVESAIESNVMHIFIYDKNETRLEKISKSLNINYMIAEPHYIHFITTKQIYINKVQFDLSDRVLIKSIETFKGSSIIKNELDKEIIVFEFNNKIEDFRVGLMIENLIQTLIDDNNYNNIKPKTYQQYNNT